MHDPFVGSERETVAPRQPSFRMSMGQLGMLLFLASLTMVFGATLIAYAITRANSPLWRDTDMPGLPLGLIATTVVMVAQAWAMDRALRAIRKNQQRQFTRALWIALGLGVVFVLGQAMNWYEMQQRALSVEVKTLYLFTFYMLTGVHALHIVGGLVPLGIVIAKARRRDYSSSRHEGVRFCVQYWHFLGVVWLVLLAALIIAT
ncbi:MAG: heme-copper oxidase subunit III [Polyangiaceae bacterium]|nr:heme-copper oxidase subunit III [Polyangiaceae bacterium]MCW5791484.1 heme-copper oxidase subunit III [Polyangiaceae bacterium]